MQAAEPAVGKVKMHRLAKPAFGPDTKIISGQQHADQQFWINGWPASVALGFSKIWTDTAQVDETVNRPHQVVLRHLIVNPPAFASKLNQRQGLKSTTFFQQNTPFLAINTNGLERSQFSCFSRLSKGVSEIPELAELCLKYQNLSCLGCSLRTCHGSTLH